jgi:PncC family amidohydrolase
MKSSLLENTISILRESETAICCVESCTGGQIASAFTEFSGISDVFWGSFVVYHNSAKELLGVLPSLIQEKGAVSSEVAAALAEQGLSKMQKAIQTSKGFSQLKAKNLICISTTGVAGPTGGSIEKPVGLCYLGIASTFKASQTEKFQTMKVANRMDTQSQFCEKAFELLHQYLKNT